MDGGDGSPSLPCWCRRAACWPRGTVRALPGPAPPAVAESAGRSTGGRLRLGWPSGVRPTAVGRPARAVCGAAAEPAADHPGAAAAAARAGPTGSTAPTDQSRPGRIRRSGRESPAVGVRRRTRIRDAPGPAGPRRQHRTPPVAPDGHRRLRRPGRGCRHRASGYAWPLHPPPAVLSPFRAPEHAYGPGHRGADLAGSVGQPVLAARAGVVVFAGPVGGRGVVSVQHDDGLRTTYEPVQPMVRAGTAVAAGAVLGVLAARPSGLHAGLPALGRAPRPAGVPRPARPAATDPGAAAPGPRRVTGTRWSAATVADLRGASGLSRRRAPPAARAAARPGGCAAGTPGTR